MAVRNNGALDGDRMVQLKATWGVMNGVSSFRARREDETGHTQPHNKKNGSPSTDGFLGYFLGPDDRWRGDHGLLTFSSVNAFRCAINSC